MDYHRDYREKYRRSKSKPYNKNHDYYNSYYYSSYYDNKEPEKISSKIEIGNSVNINRKFFLDKDDLNKYNLRQINLYNEYLELKSNSISKILPPLLPKLITKIHNFQNSESEDEKYNYKTQRKNYKYYTRGRNLNQFDIRNNFRRNRKIYYFRSPF